MTAEIHAPPTPALPEPLRSRTPAATRLIDRYILRETMRPLGIALAVVLLALVLERLLRLFDLVANRGGPIEEILKMAANLIPHYLGLALPAAFFISIFVVVTKFGEDNEFEALQSTGLSIRRIARPFLWLGLLLALTSVALYGFIQPYSRYAYRAIYHAVINAAWDATVTEALFIDAGDGVTVTADEVDGTGRRLAGVFVHQKLNDGSELVTTGATGQLLLNEERTRLFLTLENGAQVRTTAEGRVDIGRFGKLTLDRPFAIDPPPFRGRGDTERELTLIELWEEQSNPQTEIAPARLQSELNARLVRALSLPFMPLLAIPMGMAAKRAKRGPGIALAAVLLVIYHHSIQLGESLGDVGRASPAVAVWSPFLVFATLSWSRSIGPTSGRGENPFSRAFDAIDSFWNRCARLMRRREPTGP